MMMQLFAAAYVVKSCQFQLYPINTALIVIVKAGWFTLVM